MNGEGGKSARPGSGGDEFRPGKKKWEEQCEVPPSSNPKTPLAPNPELFINCFTLLTLNLKL
jgi:hypothetical protein